jgi:hypothetical protein
VNPDGRFLSPTIKHVHMSMEEKEKVERKFWYWGEYLARAGVVTGWGSDGRGFVSSWENFGDLYPQT